VCLPILGGHDVCLGGPCTHEMRAGFPHSHQHRALGPMSHCTRLWGELSGYTCRHGHVPALLLRGSCDMAVLLFTCGVATSGTSAFLTTIKHSATSSRGVTGRVWFSGGFFVMLWTDSRTVGAAGATVQHCAGHTTVPAAASACRDTLGQWCCRVPHYPDGMLDTLGCDSGCITQRGSPVFAFQGHACSDGALQWMLAHGGRKLNHTSSHRSLQMLLLWGVLGCRPW
jgi:hypothetical protein